MQEFAILALSCSLLCAGGATGKISGRLMAEDGKAVDGAIVIAHLSGLSTATARSASTRSGSDGSFSLSGLAEGWYEVCVLDRKDGYLDPCRWSNSPPTVDLLKAEQHRMPNITLKQGRLLQVHVADDTGSLAKSPTHGSEILIGVWQDNGLFVTVPLKTSDANGRVHELYVPGDRPLQLSASGNSYVLTDENGQQASTQRGLTKRLDVPAGRTPITAHFRVTGAVK